MNETHEGIRDALIGSPRRESPHGRSRPDLWQRSGLGKVGTEKLARGLGWFSIGLGLAELFAPRLVARVCGGDGTHTGLIRFYGLREIAAGLMIFSGAKKPVMGMWSRVAGDALDMATLGAAALSPSTNKAGVTFAAANVAAVGALDYLCARQLSIETGSMTTDGALVLKRSVTINKPADEVYRFWRDFTNFPRFMLHLLAVHETAPNRSHWVAKGPAGSRVEWDAEITENRPGELIAWRAVGGDLQHSGVVRFQETRGGRGTVVRVELVYAPPGGMAARVFAMLFNESPDQQISDDLRRLKQVLETGEVVRSDGSPDGAGTILQRLGQPTGGGAAAFTRPGQPSGGAE